jgi:hypothetical protein
MKNAEMAEWKRVEAAWIASGKKCACGMPITLDDAFHAPHCCALCRTVEEPDEF